MAAMAAIRTGRATAAVPPPSLKPAFSVLLVPPLLLVPLLLLLEPVEPVLEPTTLTASSSRGVTSRLRVCAILVSNVNLYVCGNESTYVAIDIRDGVVEGVVVNVDNLANKTTNTVVNDVLSSRGNVRESEVVAEAIIADEAGAACGRSDAGAAGLEALDASPVNLSVLVLESVVVGHELNRAVVVDSGKTVVVVLLSELVDNTTTEDVHEVGAVDGLDLGEDTRARGIAAELGVEDGDRGGLEHGDELIVAGLGEGALTAPRVAVQGEHVGAGDVVLLVLNGALEVVPAVLENITNISSRVTDGDGAVGVVLDVVLQVTGDGTDVRGSSAALVNAGDDLVSREESKKVGVVLEVVHNRESAVEVGGVVRLPGKLRVEGLADQRGVDINDHVHAGLVEDTGALIVVDIGAQVVHTDGVDTEHLEQSSVTLANLSVRERVLAVGGIVARAATDLVGHTNDLELITTVGIDEAVAVDGQSGHSGSKSCAQGDKSRLKLYWLLVMRSRTLTLLFSTCYGASG